MKKIMAVLLIFVLLAGIFAFAACDNNDDDGSEQLLAQLRYQIALLEYQIAQQTALAASQADTAILLLSQIAHLEYLLEQLRPSAP